MRGGSGGGVRSPAGSRAANGMSPRRRRALARVGILGLLVGLIWSTQPNKRLGLRRQRAQRASDLDPALRREWEADQLPAACEAELSAVLPADHNASNPTLARSKLYGTFARGVAEQGLTVFGSDAGAATSQGLGLTALFDFHPESGKVTAKLARLAIPVRAVVIPLPPRAPAAARLGQAARRILGEAFPPTGGARGSGDSVWYQDPAVYHFSVFHASHHLDAKPATPAETRAEAAAIKAVARSSCPIEAVVERVVVTPSGVVMALWNVRGGTEPADLRRRLREALPNAPEKQIVANQVILHTTLARLLRPPPRRRLSPAGAGDAESAAGVSDGAGAATRAAAALTAALCGVQATLPRLWFVHESDKLALALNGKYDPHPMKFECK